MRCAGSAPCPAPPCSRSALRPRAGFDKPPTCSHANGGCLDGPHRCSMLCRHARRRDATFDVACPLLLVARKLSLGWGGRASRGCRLCHHTRVRTADPAHGDLQHRPFPLVALVAACIKLRLIQRIIQFCSSRRCVSGHCVVVCAAQAISTRTAGVCSWPCVRRRVQSTPPAPFSPPCCRAVIAVARHLRR